MTPHAPAQPCTAARCAHLLPCPVHKPITYAYGATHRQWRQAVLERDGYKCRVQGCTTRARVADHITPISQGGEALSLSNGQALCWSHHSSKTRRDGSAGTMEREGERRIVIA